MRVHIGTAARRTGLALVAAFATACPAAAQDNSSVTDYRLPDPSRTARPSVQGPVDPDNPVVAPTSSAEVPSVAPTVTPPPPPRTTLSPPRVSATPPPPAPTPERETRATNSSVRRSETPPPSTAPATSAPTGASPSASNPAPPVAPAVAPPTPEPTATEPAAPATSAPGDSAPWLIGIAVVLAGLGLAIWAALHRRRRADPSAGDDHQESAAPLPPSTAPQAGPPALRPKAVPAPPPPPPAPERAPQPAAPAPGPVPAPVSAGDPLPLAIVFTPGAVRLSLVFATLQYELSVTHLGDETLQDLQVRADLAAAHASLSTREQLAPDPAALQAKHEIASLAPGETAPLKGEVRVPLQGLPTLNKGSARFFVPLVRFCLVGPGGHTVRRVFTVGPQGPDGGIASVRLDAGPRNLRELVAREIEAARGFALDPASAHG